MERLLIVEDNKSLAKLIAKKIETKLNCEVDVAYSLKEASLFIRKYTYFITLLDLNLPDAPDGEVVDLMIENNLPVIVLSGNIDKEFRRLDALCRKHIRTPDSLLIYSQQLLEFSQKNNIQSV